MDKLNPEQENLFLKIKNELDEHLDKRVDEHLEKDRNLIKETIATVSTIFKWTVGIAVFLVAVLGIKTYLDIKERINSSIQENIKSNINSSNVLSIYDNKASKLYRESLIESLIIKIKKRDNDDNPFNIQLNKVEYDELLHTVMDKETEIETFNKVLYILNNVTLPKDSKENSLNKILTDFIFNKDKNYAWLEDQDDKKSYLLNSLATMGVEDCKSYCESILKDKSAKQRIKLASINYLKQINDKQSLPILEEYSKDDDDDEIQNAAVRAIAYLDFRNKVIDDYLRKLDKGAIIPMEAAKIIEVLNEILLQEYDNSNRQRFSFDQSQKEKDKIDSSISLVAQSLFKLEPYIKFSASSSFYRTNYALSLFNKKEQGTSYYGIPSKILFGYDYVVANKMLHTKELNEFIRAISFLTITIMNFNAENSDFNAVTADLTFGGGVITEHGRIDNRNLNNKCWFKPYERGLKINFWDKAGNLNSLNVLALQGIDSINFALQTKNKLSEDFSDSDN